MSQSVLSLEDIKELRDEEGLYLMAKGHHDATAFIRVVGEYMACEWGDDWQDWYQPPQPQTVDSGWGRYQFGDSVTCDEPGQVVFTDVGHRVTSMRGVFPYTAVHLDEEGG